MFIVKILSRYYILSKKLETKLSFEIRIMWKHHKKNYSYFLVSTDIRSNTFVLLVTTKIEPILVNIIL